MELITINNLSFEFDKNHKIFSNLSLSFNKGEIVLITGPSGKGKSTLASLIAGHLKPTRGSVLIEGAEIKSATRSIVVVHQENDLFPWLTVQEHLNFLTKAGITTKLDEEYSDELKKFELLQFLNLYPKELSGGMKRRLAILRAMLMKPRVIILDESMSSLDAELKQKIMSEIKLFLVKHQMLLIVIDHNATSIMDFIDRKIAL